MSALQRHLARRYWDFHKEAQVDAMAWVHIGAKATSHSDDTVEHRSNDMDVMEGTGIIMIRILENGAYITRR